MSDVVRVPISEIVVGERKRSLGDVTPLAESIAELGLLQPIVITEDRRLVAGMHRLEACRKLGWQEIDARIVQADDMRAELAEIDENLVRNELTALERAEQLARRKAIYEALHPETRKGTAQAIKMHRKLGHDVAVQYDKYVSADNALTYPSYKNDGKDVLPSNFAENTSVKTGLARRTIEEDVQIATRIPEDVRELLRATPVAESKTDLLTIARMPEEEQREVAKAIVEHGAASVKDVKKIRFQQDIARQKTEIESGAVQAPSGVFDVIAIDPPWPYGREYDPNGSRVANPYPEMSLEDIAAIDLPAADDCVLFLWTTHRFLPDAFNLMKTWGFEYKATLVWDKERIGMGAWVRMQCEFCLIGIKGRPFWSNTSLRDILREPRREHSRKPESFYQFVDAVTRGRKLDFFSREKRHGWESFGNETTKFSNGDAQGRDWGADCQTALREHGMDRLPA